MLISKYNKVEDGVCNEILISYNNGESARSIGNRIDISAHVVRQILKKNGITIRDCGNNTEDNRNKWVELYKSGLSSSQISNLTGTCRVAIQNKINRSNTKMRSRMETYNPNFNENYFENIDTEAKAYFLRLIIADGCISEPDKKNNRTNYTLRIELQSNDCYILQKFLDEIQMDSEVEKENSRGHRRIRISSNKICDDLKKYGVVPRKTGKEYLPLIDNSLMPHLVRGLIDGDGWITNVGKSNVSFGFCGAGPVVDEINKFLPTQINVKEQKTYISLKENSTIPCYQVMWSGRKNVIEIGNYLYKNATFYLDRKHERFQRMLMPR